MMKESAVKIWRVLWTLFGMFLVYLGAIGEDILDWSIEQQEKKGEL